MSEHRQSEPRTPAAMALDSLLHPVESVAVSGDTLPLKIVRNVRARRYLLRLNPDGSVRLTVPRGGTLAQARAFLQRNIAWLERAHLRLNARPRVPREWRLGTAIYWRGERVTIECAGDQNAVRFGSESVPVKDVAQNLRSVLEEHMRRVANRELPPLVHAFARQQALSVQRVRIGNQRSRWGSCSRRGTISLNWRILQGPPHVRDYLILHELMHMREMNHSPRFWAQVAEVCPGYETAERWLSQHSYLLQR